MSADVLPIGGPVQAQFDGLEVSELSFSLRSANRLWTDKKLPYNISVQGTFEGRVKGYQYVDGKLTALVEVLEATVE